MGERHQGRRVGQVGRELWLCTALSGGLVAAMVVTVITASAYAAPRTSTPDAAASERTGSQGRSSQGSGSQGRGSQGRSSQGSGSQASSPEGSGSKVSNAKATSPNKAEREPIQMVKRVPRALSRALGLNKKSGVSRAGLAAANRFITLARRGHRFDLIEGLHGEGERWIPRAWRGAAATIQIRKRLVKDKLTLAKPSRRRYIRSLFRSLSAVGRRVFQLPRQWNPGIAVVRFSQAPITNCFVNGGILISERLVAEARESGTSANATDADKLLMLWVQMQASVARERCGGLCGTPPRDEHRHHVDSTLVSTIAHELGHGLQDMVYSWPYKGWSDAENQQRELEADAIGLWLGACAGYSLDSMANQALTVAVMDATVRSMGVREANYPPFETRAPGVYTTIAAIVAAQGDGSWPKGCKPLDYEPKRMVPQRVMMPWLTRLAGKGGPEQVQRQMQERVRRGRAK